MKCILCGKDSKKVLTDTLRGGYKGKVYYCVGCDFAFLENTHNNIKEYYDNEYRKDPIHKEQGGYEGLFDLYSQFQKDRIENLKPFINQKTILLEVGCSVGMFLYHIKDHVKSAIGVDYDSNAAYFAMHKTHCAVIDDDIVKTHIKKGSLDVICAFQTLEHVIDPFSFIKKYSQYLKKGGLIYIEVPNLHDALVDVYKLPNYFKFYFHPEHLWYFSEKSLLKLMEKVGFNGKVKFIQSYNLFNHIQWINNDVGQNNCSLGLSDPQVKFRGDFDFYYFFKKIDKIYKSILSDFKKTDNLHYIGIKK